MRAVLPKLFSAEAAASGLSDEAFSAIDPLVRRLLTLDNNLATAAVKLETEPAEALHELARHQSTAFQLTREIVLTVRSQLRFDSPHSPPPIARPASGHP
jgi:hypothetical protein